MAAKKAKKSNARVQARQSASKPQPSKLLMTTTTTKAKPKSKTRREPGPRALEMQLRKTVGELGLTKARKIFASLEAAFGD